LTVDLQKKLGYYTRSLTKKEYELNDHLDNVRTTFSDRKKSNGYANMLSYNNYYAFGMKMGGTGVAGSVFAMNLATDDVSGYRYGFNGKEQDFAFNKIDG